MARLRSPFGFRPTKLLNHGGANIERFRLEDSPRPVFVGDVVEIVSGQVVRSLGFPVSALGIGVVTGLLRNAGPDDTGKAVPITLGQPTRGPFAQTSSGSMFVEVNTNPSQVYWVATDVTADSTWLFKYVSVTAAGITAAGPSAFCTRTGLSPSVVTDTTVGATYSHPFIVIGLNGSQRPNQLSEFGVFCEGVEVAFANISAAPPSLGAGNVFFGAAGHFDNHAEYDTPVSQQASELENMYGGVSNTIYYRAIGEDQTAQECQASAVLLRAQGIVPVVLVPPLRPDWNTYVNASAAYASGFTAMRDYSDTVSAASIFEIGNEWTIQVPFGTTVGDNDSRFLAATWRAAAIYPKWLGFTAGMVKGLRISRPGAKAIGGATSGWTALGLPIAMGVDLQSYNGEDLRWDFTVLHWYNDAGPGGNSMGMPDDFNGTSHYNAYTAYKPIGKPIFLTEFGSQFHAPATKTDAGTNITALMDNFVSHTNVTLTEPGVAAACVYQMYRQTAFDQYGLYDPPGSIAPEGTAVKNWVITHGNPAH